MNNTVYVRSGQVVSGMSIDGGGYVDNPGLYVLDGGKTISTTLINSGAVEYINGGITSNTICNYSGLQYITSGGAFYTEINNDARVILEGKSAFISGATINSGGRIDAYSGANVSLTNIASGGLLYIHNFKNDEVVALNTLNNGGLVDLLYNAKTIFTELNNDGLENISSGSLSISATINNGGYQGVFSGGTASAATVNKGGYQDVEKRGTVVETIINSGGHQTLNGVGSSIIVNIGGEQYVSPAGVASMTTINGGHQLLCGIANN